MRRAQQNHTVWTALLDGVQGTIGVGSVLVLNAVGDRYLVSTAANRTATGRKSAGVAISAGSEANPAVEFLFCGVLAPSQSLLGIGAVSPLRVSSAGLLERVAVPAPSDEVVGTCDADGTAYVVFASASSSSGGGGAPVDAQYLTLATNSTLTVERVLTAGTGISFADGGAGSTLTINASGGATPGGTTGMVQTNNGASGFAGTSHGAVGAVLRQTGATTSAFGAVDLADTDAVTGVLPEANQADQTMAGDVTGPTGTSVVARVNGATYPAAGALTTGTVPRVTGVSAVAYGALDLANANAVTGVLPTGNVASHTGDVTGAHGATVVARVNGATVPAAGSLTTGNVARVSGASALTYSALNLAGGAGFVSGLLPIGNIGAPTGTGYAKVTSGAWNAASQAVPIPVADGGTGVTSLGTASRLLRNNAGVVGDTANTTHDGTGLVMGTAGYYAFAASNPTNEGVLRLGNANVAAVAFRNSVDSADIVALGVTATNTVVVGSDSSFTAAKQADSTTIASGSGGFVQLVLGSNTYMLCQADQVRIGRPIVGSAANTRALEFDRASVNVGTGATYTLLAAEYSRLRIHITTATGVDTGVIFPNGEGVWIVRNTSGFTVVVRDTALNASFNLLNGRTICVAMESNTLRQFVASFAH